MPGAVYSVVAKRIARLAGGWFLIVAGIVLLPLPGPGSLVILSGLALLSKDSAWAGSVMARLRAALKARRKEPKEASER